LALPKLQRLVVFTVQTFSCISDVIYIAKYSCA